MQEYFHHCSNENLKDDEHDYKFVGKTGSFIPVIPGSNGGILLRYVDENKFSSAVGAKGYRWMESEIVQKMKLQNNIDMSYYKTLTDDAKDVISKFGDFERFTS